ASLGEGEFGEALEKMDSSAFKESGLTAVTFNTPNLTTIGSNAFQKSTVEKAAFNAPNLETIGSAAFDTTLINEFILEKTKVKKIESNTLSNCKNLTTASFGPELMQLSDNAISGCAAFSTLRIYDYTTVSEKVFYAKGSSDVDSAYTAKDSKGSITIEVKPVNDTVTIPIGVESMLPYYVSQHSDAEGFSAFDYLLIGAGIEDEGISSHISVKAQLADGYYRNQKTVDYKISDAGLYTKEPVFEQRNETGFNLSEKRIERIAVTGLSGTAEKVPLTVVGKANFTLDSGAGYEIKAGHFEAKYYIEVKDAPFHANIYSGRDRKEEEFIDNSQPVTYQSSSTNNVKQFYYDIVRDENEGADDGITTPDTYSLVIKTTNPDVVYPALTYNGKVDALTDGAVTKVIDKVNNKVTAKPNDQNYYLTFAGAGEADITVYPEGHENWKKTFHYVVSSDLKSITLKVPETYMDKNGDIQPITEPNNKLFEEGDTLNIFEKCENWFGQTADVAAGEAYGMCSNKEIVFSLQNESDAAYVSLSQDGTVKILQNDVNIKYVTIFAKALKESANQTTPQYTQANVRITINKGVPKTIAANAVKLYSDYARAKEIAAETKETIEMQNPNKKTTKQIYFSVSNSEGLLGDYFDTCDVTVETSNPDVLYPSETANGQTVQSITTTKGTGTYGKPQTGSQMFYLIASGDGTVNIKVYPKGHQEGAKTYTFEVKAAATPTPTPTPTPSPTPTPTPTRAPPPPPTPHPPRT
ncbi:MAG: leucine-rich repeat domain-containing protein, partial [Lachnospiraceae bacterium]|nr:leucine-rich repeat domain-containing protein [Lachnospiraceae bacterium]